MPILDSSTAAQLAAVRASGLLDFRSETIPTWCPGCGYYGILHALLLTLKRRRIDPKNLVCVSGIGCSGRFPYFLKAYGFHTLHGRPLPVACGIKMSSPELTVLAVSGDGDGLAIGGGHLMHAMRRNVDIVYCILDNGIYGLTKGQASPTTPLGQVTATTPYGNPERPVNPTLLGLAYGTGFVARGYAGAVDEMTEIFDRAFAHRGFSFIHVLSPCLAFDREHITYEKTGETWQPLPKNHDPSDLKAALALARETEFSTGVFYQAKEGSR